jgi:RNA polymerase sigma-70 factor (ECF subfamily)
MSPMTAPAPSQDPLQARIDAAVARVRLGDREAYRAVIEVCEARLRLVVAGVLPDSTQVEDVVQQAFVLAYTKLDQYQTGTGFMAWVATIARYEALNERRRWLSERSMRQRYGAELRLEQAIGPEPEAPEGFDQATVAGLHACIEALQGRAAAVVRAHYFEKRDNELIASEHGRSAAWVRLVLHRARQALADCLKLKHGVRCDL